VGGREFPRISLIAGTANYDLDNLRHYENKVKKIFNSEANKKIEAPKDNIFDQNEFLKQDGSNEIEIPKDFDFYKDFKRYSTLDTPSELLTAIIKVRDDEKNYLTNFPKPLMERFYWTVLVHPKYDKRYMKTKDINVLDHLKSRKSIYTQRELISHLYASDFDRVIKDWIKDTIKDFNDVEVETNPEEWYEDDE